MSLKSTNGISWSAATRSLKAPLATSIDAVLIPATATFAPVIFANIPWVFNSIPSLANLWLNMILIGTLTLLPPVGTDTSPDVYKISFPPGRLILVLVGVIAGTSSVVLYESATHLYVVPCVTSIVP
ncbi:hypothetical protein D3C80_1407790 [compost metagenome]